MKILRALKSNFCSQKFGQNLNPIYHQEGLLGHNGIDFVATDGEEIRFNIDTRGTVVHLSDSLTYGIGVTVDTVDEYGNGYRHIYWHLKDYVVKVGDVLDTGDLIGHADNTGQSTGTHLHYGIYPCVKENGEWITNPALNHNGYEGAVDPMPWFQNIFVLDYLSMQTQAIGLLQKIIALCKLLQGKK
jgi:murein DD-endopeptidase MepM/ murein hydrolase activator NlpD